MNRRYFIWSLVVVVFLFTLGLGVGYSFWSRGKNPQMAVMQAYTAEGRYVINEANGNSRTAVVFTRHALADGRYAEIRTEVDTDGVSNTIRRWYIPAKGLFKISKNGDQLIFAGFPTKPFPASSEYRKLNMAERRFFGVSAFNPKNSATQENWFSPELNLILLSIIKSSDGSNTVEEITSIKFEAPDPKVFEIPDLPISYKFIDDFLTTRQSRGLDVSQMQGDLARIKASLGDRLR